MAKVVIKVLGSTPREIDADTVGAVKRQLGLSSYSASVNGESAQDGYGLRENDFVTLSPSVKGGN